MKVRVLKSPDRRFTPFVRKATMFFGQSLMSKRMLDLISITIRFDDSITDYGGASVSGMNDAGKPRQFTIELHPGIGAPDILETLAHEMVHVRQYAQGHLGDGLERWKGCRTKVEEMDYYARPWEAEAMALEEGLLFKFKMAEKLWEVFEGFTEPGQPIRPIPLGWRQSLLAMSCADSR